MPLRGAHRSGYTGALHRAWGAHSSAGPWGSARRTLGPSAFGRLVRKHVNFPLCARFRRLRSSRRVPSRSPRPVLHISGKPRPYRHSLLRSPRPCAPGHCFPRFLATLGIASIADTRSCRASRSAWSCWISPACRSSESSRSPIRTARASTSADSASNSSAVTAATAGWRWNGNAVVSVATNSPPYLDHCPA